MKLSYLDDYLLERARLLHGVVRGLRRIALVRRRVRQMRRQALEAA